MTYDECKNCAQEIDVPDDRTGVIHCDGRYACHALVTDANGKVKEQRLDTVAE